VLGYCPEGDGESFSVEAIMRVLVDRKLNGS
jgi:hypothetical protein